MGPGQQDRGAHRPRQPRAGHVTRRRRSPIEPVSVPDAIPAIITPDTWARAQEDARANTHHRTASKPPRRSYALRSVLACGHCGRRLAGETRASRAGAETVRYVCKLRGLYPGQVAHPLDVTVAASTITGLIDQWVVEELSPARLELHAAELAAADGSGTPHHQNLERLRAERRAATARIARIHELMQDPDYPLDTTKAALADQKTKLARLEADMAAAGAGTAPAWSVEDYQAALDGGLGDIASLLQIATADEKNRLYQLLGLHLTYTRTSPGTGHLAAAIRPRLQPRGQCYVSEDRLATLLHAPS